MTHVAMRTEVSSSSGNLEQQIRARIDSLSYLPTAAAVAMKFVELGKNLEADPSEYAKVISADSSLSSKILALANSSWAGVRNKVTNVKTAINLLGLGTVRTVGVSYCLTGLHNELRLSPEESQLFWESSLCKAAAAKEFASRFDVKLADEAFLVGLLQDFAVPVMYAVGKERYLEILRTAATNAQVQLQKERGLFRMDHAEAGRIMAQKLALPDLFVDAIAFHHNLEKLNEFVENEGLADAVYVASLFPHPLSEWHRENVDALCACLREHAESIDAKEYLAEVQREFYKVYSFFHKGAAPETQLTDLFESAAREAANNTTELVGTVNELMRQAATAGMEMNDLLRQQDQLQEKTTRDPLTGVLNREGFNAEANELLAKAARYSIGFAVAYLDIDQFKALNDTFSHEFGDFALKTMVAGVTEAMPQNHLLGRMGGDEFVLVLNDCTEERAKQILDHVLSNVGGKTVRKRNHATQIFVSAGLVYVCPTSRKQELDALVCAADKLMYQAKRAGGNRLQMQSIQA